MTTYVVTPMPESSMGLTAKAVIMTTTESQIRLAKVNMEKQSSRLLSSRSKTNTYPTIKCQNGYPYTVNGRLQMHTQKTRQIDYLCNHPWTKVTSSAQD